MAPHSASRDDVARKVGVSPVTVSRCFTNPDLVSPASRQKILAAALELGYHPNRGASVLRSQRTGRIALIERGLREGKEWEGNRQYDYLFKAAYQGILHGLADSVYSLAYLPVRSAQDLQRVLARVPVDGILGMNLEEEDEAALIANAGLPYVLAHNTSHLTDLSHCYTDNYQGGFLTGRHLFETGHRKVIYLTSRSSEVATHRDRLEGFRDGLGAASLVEVLDLPSRGRDEGREAADLIQAAFRSGSGLDAVGVLNDETAVSLVQNLSGRGIRIPEDLSLVGYDHNPLADWLPFRLTTIDMNLEVVYRSAVTALLDSLRQGLLVQQSVSPTLVLGTSVLPRT